MRNSRLKKNLAVQSGFRPAAQNARSAIDDNFFLIRLSKQDRAYAAHAKERFDSVEMAKPGKTRTGKRERKQKFAAGEEILFLVQNASEVGKVFFDELRLEWREKNYKSRSLQKTGSQ